MASLIDRFKSYQIGKQITMQLNLQSKCTYIFTCLFKAFKVKWARMLKSWPSQAGPIFLEYQYKFILWMIRSK